MTKVLVKRATAEDVEEVIRNIRDADRLEIESATGKPYDEVLRGLPKLCDEMWAGFADGKCGVLFGFQKPTFVSEHTVAWLISTKMVDAEAITFIRNSKKVFGLMCKGHEYLFNFVDSRNKLAIRWLKWLGFTIYDPEPYGARGELFHKFDMRVA